MNKEKAPQLVARLFAVVSLLFALWILADFPDLEPIDRWRQLDGVAGCLTVAIVFWWLQSEYKRKMAVGVSAMFLVLGLAVLSRVMTG